MGYVDPEGLNSLAPFAPGSTFGTESQVISSQLRNPACRTPHGAAACAGFITGVIGTSIYFELQNLANMQDDDCVNDNNSEEDCKRIKDECIKGCSDFVLPKLNSKRKDLGGMDFHRWVKKCLDRNGC